MAANPLRKYASRSFVSLPASVRETQMVDVVTKHLSSRPMQAFLHPSRSYNARISVLSVCVHQLNPASALVYSCGSVLPPLRHSCIERITLVITLIRSHFASPPSFCSRTRSARETPVPGFCLLAHAPPSPFFIGGLGRTFVAS